MFNVTLIDSDRWLAMGIVHYFSQSRIKFSVLEEEQLEQIPEYYQNSQVVISELTAWGRDVQYFVDLFHKLIRTSPHTRLITLTDLQEDAVLNYVSILLPGMFMLSKRSPIQNLADLLFANNDHPKAIKRVSLKPILTPKEFQLLRPLASGKNLTQVAKMLNLSVKTISHHRKNIIKKLGCSNAWVWCKCLSNMGFIKDS